MRYRRAEFSGYPEFAAGFRDAQQVIHGTANKRMNDKRHDKETIAYLSGYIEGMAGLRGNTVNRALSYLRAYAASEEKRTIGANLIDRKVFRVKRKGKAEYLVRKLPSALILTRAITGGELRK